jgi:fructokinase
MTPHPDSAQTHEPLPSPGGVLLIGEALADSFPEHTVIGGAPFNVARNLGALGRAPHFVSRVGDDDLGHEIAAQCAAFGVATAGLQIDPALATGVVDVHMNGSAHSFHIRENAAWDAIDSTAAMACVSAAQPAWIGFGTLAQRDARSRAALYGALAVSPARRFLDLNLRSLPEGGVSNRELSEASLALAQVVKVNDEELAQLLAWFGRGLAPALQDFASPDHLAAIAELMRRFDIELIVVTRGAQGYAAFGRTRNGIFEPLAQGSTPPVRVTDTVGAGDAFSAVLLAGLLDDWPLATTLARAADFAAMVCTLRGAVAADPAHYAPWRGQWFGTASTAGHDSAMGGARPAASIPRHAA